MKAFRFAVWTMAACAVLGEVRLFAAPPIPYPIVASPYRSPGNVANGEGASANAYGTTARYPSQSWGDTTSGPATVVSPSATPFSPGSAYRGSRSSCGPNGCPDCKTRGSRQALPGSAGAYSNPTCPSGNCPTGTCPKAQPRRTYKVVPAYGTYVAPAGTAPSPYRSPASVSPAAGRGSPFYP